MLLKLYTESAWIWVKYQMKGRDFPIKFKQISSELVLKENTTYLI